MTERPSYTPRPNNTIESTTTIQTVKPNSLVEATGGGLADCRW